VILLLRRKVRELRHAAPRRAQQLLWLQPTSSSHHARFLPGAARRLPSWLRAIRSRILTGRRRTRLILLGGRTPI